MTRDEAQEQYMRINRWRQRLVYQSFFEDKLQPWQEMQLAAYCDEMDRLEPLVYPEMYAALDERERLLDKQRQLADVIGATVRYWTAIAESREPDEADVEAHNRLEREIGSESAIHD